MTSASEGSSSNEAADFTGKISQKGGVVNISSSIALKKRVYEAEDYPGFKDAVGAWIAIEEKTLVIK